MSTVESLTEELRAICETIWKSPLRKRSDWSWFEGHPSLCEEGRLFDLSEPIRMAVDIADTALLELQNAKKKQNKERVQKIMKQAEETMLRLSLIVKDEIERRNQKDLAAAETVRASFESLKESRSKTPSSSSPMRISKLQYKRREIEKMKNKQKSREIERERERVRKGLEKQLEVRHLRVRERTRKVKEKADDFFRDLRSHQQKRDNILERFRESSRTAMTKRIERVRELKQNIQKVSKRIAFQKERARQEKLFEETKSRMETRANMLNQKKRDMRSRAKKLREEIDIISIAEAKSNISKFRGSPFEAVRRGKLDVLKCFFAVKGFDKMLALRERRGGKTLLHHACRRGHPSVVQFLVHAGCDVNAIDTAYNRFTPLLEAARAGHSSICRFLVRNGAKSNHKDFGGDTMIHWAVRRGHGNVLKDLMSEECKTDGTEGLLKMRNARGKIAGDVAKNKNIGRLFERALDFEIHKKERKNMLKRRVKSGLLRANMVGHASGVLWKIRSKGRFEPRLTRTAG